MNQVTHKRFNFIINKRFSGNPGVQAGAVLVLALVMLTVLTLIGVSSMSSSSLELKVASNAQQHNIAFQGAQSRLAFASSPDPVNPINFLIAVNLNDPPSAWPVQTCNPADGCPDGTDWVSTAEARYLDCAKGVGSSMEAGKGFSFRTFEITANAETATSSSRSIQVGAVRFPVKGCGDEIL